MRLVDLDSSKVVKFDRDWSGNCVYSIPPDMVPLNEDEDFIDFFVGEHIDEYLKPRSLCTASTSFLNGLEEETEMAKAEAHDKGYAEGVKDTERVYEKQTEHGYWKVGFWKKCSVCGYEAEHTTPYCPACGAKMDKKAPKVVIKNFEIPECCDDCFAFDDNGDYPTCGITNWSKGYNWSPRGGRMDNCPLEEVE